MQGSNKVYYYDLFMLISISMFMLTNIIEGFLRYHLFYMNAEWIIYIPKIILIIGILVSSILYKPTKTHYYFIAFTVFFSIIGLVYIDNYIQVFFGLWTLVPLLFGISFLPTLLRRQYIINILFSCMLLVSTTAVIINGFVRYPWEGLSYSLAGMDIEGTRVWTYFGFSRLAGLARVSFEAAPQILVLCIYLSCFIGSQTIKIIMWTFACIAILMTTTKGIILAFFILTLFWISYTYIYPIIWQSTLAVFGFAMILLPIATCKYQNILELNNLFTHILFHSIEDRFLTTWPNAIDLLNESGNWITGRGIGGIGAAQKYFEPYLYNPGDNMFIYLFITIGAIALPLLVYIIVASLHLEIRKNRFDNYIYCIMLAIYMYGAVSNIVESTFFSIFIGIALRYILTNTSLPRKTIIKQPIAG